MTDEAQALTLQQENEDLRLQNEVLRNAMNRLCPHLLDDERERSRSVWEAASYAHNNSKQGEPGPWAVIAAAIKDGETRGELRERARTSKGDPNE